MAIEKDIRIKGEDTIVKISENNVSLKIRCLNLLDSYRYLDSSSDKLSTSLKPFLSPDPNGKEDEIFKRKLAYLYENR